MSESTTPAQCRDDDWSLARDCGLMAATPGTNAWDAALGRFADGVRAPLSTPAAASQPFGTGEKTEAEWKSYAASQEAAHPAEAQQSEAVANELNLIVAVLTGYPKSMARNDALRAVDEIRRILAASIAPAPRQSGCAHCGSADCIGMACCMPDGKPGTRQSAEPAAHEPISVLCNVGGVDKVLAVETVSRDDGGLIVRVNPAAATADEARDAARYRWLRDNRDVLLITGFFGNGCINRSIAEVEAAIDAALRATDSKEG